MKPPLHGRGALPRRLLAAAAGALVLTGAAGDATVAPLRAEALAPGAWHVPAQVAVWTPDARELLANAGFVAGRDCIAVIDSGGSEAVGRALREAIRRASPLPVCYLIQTHAHPDHALGAAAFVEPGAAPPVRVVAHARYAAAAAARAPYWLKSLQEEASARLARLPAPTLTVETTRELDLGGRVLEVRAWPTAHTDNDLTVLDRASGTLWLGDLGFVQHLPVVDGRLVGWRAALDTLRGWRVARAVPGHGPVIQDWPAGLAPQAAYLAGLEADVRAALRAGLTLAQTVERLGDPAPHVRAGWSLVDAFHRRNVTAAYAELEWSE